ncbi:MAG: cellulase family glycosylhydrolase [Breznakibacter sp.]
MNASDDGGEFTVYLNANGEFSVNVSNSWVSVLEKTDTSVKFSVSSNQGTARTATITFTCGSASAEFVVKQEAGENTVGGSDAMAVAQSLGLGWNLGNQLDAHNNGIANETAWGNPATTQSAFDKIAASGIRSVRIPVTWLGHVGSAPDYTIDASWLNRVAEIVNYAETAGLKAIINIHHDGADSNYWLDIKNAATSETVNNQVKAQLIAMWTQIAEKFKDKGNFLIFESMNEIHDGGWGWGANRTDGGKQYAVLNEWNQIFVDAVRATGGNNSDRYLGVPGYVTNPDLTLNYFVLPTDAATNRLMVSVHYYDPYEYTLNDKYSEWGHTAASDKKESYGDEADMKSMFGKLKTKYVDNGIPVYIGEFGCVHRSTERAESFRKYYLEYICKAAKTYGLALFYWDNGSAGTGKESSGLLNHGTGNYINNGKDIIDIMVKAIKTEDPLYTLDSVYDSAP